MEFLTNQNILLYLTTYLIASIPFGYLLAKRFAGVDIQKAGSGNIGATNVLRVVKEKNPLLAKKLGATTLFLDGLKGILVMVIAMILDAPEGVLWSIALFAVMGHCFSLFLWFEGGKGVATGFSAVTVMLPYAGLITIVVWAILAKGLKISSLSSLVSIGVFVLSSYIVYPVVPDINSHAPVWIIAMLILYKHTPNIMRLLNKEESQV